MRHFVNIEEGLEHAGFTITTKAWMDAYDAICQRAKKEYYAGVRKEAEAVGVKGQAIMLFAMGRTCPEPDYELPLDGEGDTAVYVLARNSGEGTDRKPQAGDVELTKTEIRDILALNQKYERFVLVLNVGGMVNLEPVNAVGTVLLLGQLGSATGDAFADVLLGRRSRSMHPRRVLEIRTIRNIKREFTSDTGTLIPLERLRITHLDMVWDIQHLRLSRRTLRRTPKR